LSYRNDDDRFLHLRRFGDDRQRFRIVMRFDVLHGAAHEEVRFPFAKRRVRSVVSRERLHRHADVGRFVQMIDDTCELRRCRAGRAPFRGRENELLLPGRVQRCDGKKYDGQKRFQRAGSEL